MTSRPGRPPAFAWVVCVPLAFAVGCGPNSDGRPARQPTSGRVTYNGKPASGALVMLWPMPVNKTDWQAVKPQGVAGDDGTFHLISYEPGDGAPAGEYAITVRWSGPNAPPGPDLLGDRYSDPLKPLRKVTIHEGKNEIPVIELTGPTIQTRPNTRSGD